MPPLHTVCSVSVRQQIPSPSLRFSSQQIDCAACAAHGHASLVTACRRRGRPPAMVSALQRLPSRPRSHRSKRPHTTGARHHRRCLRARDSDHDRDGATHTRRSPAGPAKTLRQRPSAADQLARHRHHLQARSSHDCVLQWLGHRRAIVNPASCSATVRTRCCRGRRRGAGNQGCRDSRSSGLWCA